MLKGMPRKLAQFVKVSCYLRCGYPRCEANIQVQADDRYAGATLLVEEGWSVVEDEVRCPSHKSPMAVIDGPIHKAKIKRREVKA